MIGTNHAYSSNLRNDKFYESINKVLKEVKRFWQREMYIIQCMRNLCLRIQRKILETVTWEILGENIHTVSLNTFKHFGSFVSCLRKRSKIHCTPPLTPREIWFYWIKIPFGVQLFFLTKLHVWRQWILSGQIYLEVRRWSQIHSKQSTTPTSLFVCANTSKLLELSRVTHRNVSEAKL